MGSAVGLPVILYLSILIGRDGAEEVADIHGRNFRVVTGLVNNLRGFPLLLVVFLPGSQLVMPILEPLRLEIWLALFGVHGLMPFEKCSDPLSLVCENISISRRPDLGGHSIVGRGRKMLGFGGVDILVFVLTGHERQVVVCVFFAYPDLHRRMPFQEPY